MRIVTASAISAAISSGQYDPRAPVLPAQPGRLERIGSEGVLRVGYLPDALPWVFRNLEGEYVGFDMEWLARFANDLDARIEMVRLEPGEIDHALDSSQVDLFASGQIMDPLFALEVATSRPYHEVTLALLVDDHRRSEFDEIDQVRRRTDLNLAVTRSPALQRAVQQAFPNFEVSYVDSPRGFVEGEMPEIDGVILPAETASAWTLVYPNHTVVVPTPSSVQLPVVVALPRSDQAFRLFVNDWLQLADSMGRLDEAYQRWILGQETEAREPRWSVIRDVLGWVD
ncbi:MAG: transporter substrate-binding domain-containing protein [Xanthomonadales bacterium]|nr:transporter substrate-binding domain-containing protein [Xanthomonadales bacterium]NNK37972.1 transporter substrate-binding domain-containing protein [Xanthomonadales bacterium]